MTFILDASGRVERKLVEANYRLRYGGNWLLQELLGKSEPAARLEARTTGPLAIISGRAWLDSPTYFPYQRLGLHLEISIEPSWHVYGPVVPPGYTGLGIAVRSEPEGVRAGAVEWPATKPFRIEGLEEEFAVYEGTIELVAPVEFILPRNSGVARVAIVVTFQTCNATECLPPNAIELVLEVPEAPAP
ncbi:MAG: protein-disulfide reductase DsbD domain-containing protein [Chloroflexota bacterium]